jgi:3-(3-hydroxy-phenyl)propionate hydroxylase
VAERWREGRVFLAGDAAHMQPPFLGQGMCQGVRDAANLAWKLTSVLKGKVKGLSAEKLLDSYGEERKAHVTELTSRIKAVGAVVCERDVEKARARDFKLLRDCGGIVKDTPRQDVLPSLTTGLIFPSPGAGTLFPQPRMQAGQLMDRLHGYQWRWVTDGTLTTIVPQGVNTVDLTVEPEAEGVVALWMQRHGVHAALVRPDHYVFASAANASDAQKLFANWQAHLE